MGYISVAATYVTTGTFVPTKKALREALATNPENVRFVSVGGLNKPFFGPATDLADEATTLTVCGPNPQTDRRWWANIKVKGGRIYMDDKVIKATS